MKAATKVKVCGIRRSEDAWTAVNHGAWAIGFLFWSGSKRYIAPDSAAPLIRALPSSVLPVGVFVNATPDEIAAAISRSGIRGIQLHGEEEAGLVAQVRRAHPEHFLIRAFRPAQIADVEAMRPFVPHVDSILIDSATGGARGGTGKLADWGLAREARRIAPMTHLILSGGLKAENVREGIESVTPDAIDVSSGVEESPGVKSPEKIAAFFETLNGNSGGLK